MYYPMLRALTALLLLILCGRAHAQQTAPVLGPTSVCQGTQASYRVAYDTDELSCGSDVWAWTTDDPNAQVQPDGAQATITWATAGPHLVRAEANSCTCTTRSCTTVLSGTIGVTVSGPPVAPVITAQSYNPNVTTPSATGVDYCQSNGALKLLPPSGTGHAWEWTGDYIKGRHANGAIDVEPWQTTTYTLRDANAGGTCPAPVGSFTVTVDAGSPSPQAFTGTERFGPGPMTLAVADPTRRPCTRG